MEFGIHATELLSVGRLCYCQLPTHILTTPGLTKDLKEEIKEDPKKRRIMPQSFWGDLFIGRPAS